LRSAVQWLGSLNPAWGNRSRYHVSSAPALCERSPSVDWRLLVPRLGGNQDTGDVAAGRAFIRDQSRIALDRGDPQHLLHRGLAARAR
jgi:hypothetical protein